MPSYAAELPVEDRWAIVAYVRALQLSQYATLDQVPPDAAPQARGGGAMKLGPWEGGVRARNLAGAVGAAGLALTLVGGILGDPRRALYAYLVAFVYWLGIALGALILLGSLPRREREVAGGAPPVPREVPASLPIFVVLFVPIAARDEAALPLGRPGRPRGRAPPHRRAQAPVPQRRRSS